MIADKRVVLMTTSALHDPLFDRGVDFMYQTLIRACALRRINCWSSELAFWLRIWVVGLPAIQCPKELSLRKYPKFDG